MNDTAQPRETEESKLWHRIAEWRRHDADAPLLLLDMAALLARARKDIDGHGRRTSAIDAKWDERVTDLLKRVLRVERWMPSFPEARLVGLQQELRSLADQVEELKRRPFGGYGEPGGRGVGGRPETSSGHVTIGVDLAREPDRTVTAEPRCPYGDISGDLEARRCILRVHQEGSHAFEPRGEESAGPRPRPAEPGPSPRAGAAFTEEGTDGHWHVKGGRCTGCTDHGYRDALRQAAAAICEECADGMRATRTSAERWWHANDGWRVCVCAASKIRERMDPTGSVLAALRPRSAPNPEAAR